MNDTQLNETPHGGRPERPAANFPRQVTTIGGIGMTTILALGAMSWNGLSERLDRVEGSLHQIELKLERLTELRDRVDDHEVRLRKLEQAERR